MEQQKIPLNKRLMNHMIVQYVEISRSGNYTDSSNHWIQLVITTTMMMAS
jgi:hypothetical protein